MDRSRGGRRQFTLAALFGITALAAAVFAVFRWLGLEPRTSLFVVAVSAVALTGAIGLVVAIGRYAIENGEAEGDGDSAGSMKKEADDPG